jgi:hypothetical protein
MSVHKLLVRDQLTSMEFASVLTVGDNDLLVLIHSMKGKQPEIQISFVVTNATGANQIARFNEVMSSALSLPTTQPLATGNAIEIRVFTRSDANEIREVLRKNGISAMEKEFTR